jgi:hypothetical protein
MIIAMTEATLGAYQDLAVAVILGCGIGLPFIVGIFGSRLRIPEGVRNWLGVVACLVIISVFIYALLYFKVIHR